MLDKHRQFELDREFSKTMGFIDDLCPHCEEAPISYYEVDACDQCAEEARKSATFLQVALQFMDIVGRKPTGKELVSFWDHEDAAYVSLIKATGATFYAV